MAGKYSQSPALELGDDSNYKGMEGARMIGSKRKEMEEKVSQGTTRSKIKAESFLLQMLKQIRPSTGDLAIEVLVETIMETGGQELKDALEVVEKGMRTGPGREALVFCRILTGLARVSGERIRREALLVLEKNVLDLYYRVEAEVRTSIRGLVLELKEMLDVSKVNRMLDEIDKEEWLVEKGYSKEMEGSNKQTGEMVDMLGLEKMVIIVDDRGNRMKTEEFVQKIQEKTGIGVKIAVADKLMEIGEWEEEISRAVTLPGPERLVIMAQTGDMLKYRVEQKGGRKYPQLGLNIGFKPAEYARELESKVGMLRDRYPDVEIVLLGPPVMNLGMHNRSLRGQVGLEGELSGKDREEQKELNNWILEVREEQLRNPRILYWDLTTYFLDNKKRGVPTEAFKNGRTYRPTSLVGGYELSELGLDLFVRDIGKRVKLTQKGEAKELWDRMWEQMET